MIVVLLGPPGSGKGTQAKLMWTERRWPQLSTGDMLRAAIENGSKLGSEAKSYMDQGKLVPDSVVIGLIEERIKAGDCKQGIILDGFPRNISQAESLDLMLEKQGRAVDRVVLFQIADEELVKRISGRRTCSQCNSMYHVDSAQSKKPNICDQCGSALIQRPDDRSEIVKQRLVVYHNQTEPLVGFYGKQSKLKVLDARRPATDVAQALAEALR